MQGLFEECKRHKHNLAVMEKELKSLSDINADQETETARAYEQLSQQVTANEELRGDIRRVLTRHDDSEELARTMPSMSDKFTKVHREYRKQQALKGALICHECRDIINRGGRANRAQTGLEAKWGLFSGRSAPCNTCGWLDLTHGIAVVREQSIYPGEGETEAAVMWHILPSPWCPRCRLEGPCFTMFENGYRRHGTTHEWSIANRYSEEPFTRKDMIEKFITTAQMRPGWAQTARRMLTALGPDKCDQCLAAAELGELKSEGHLGGCVRPKGLPRRPDECRLCANTFGVMDNATGRPISGCPNVLCSLFEGQPTLGGEGDKSLPIQRNYEDRMAIKRGIEQGTTPIYLSEDANEDDLPLYNPISSNKRARDWLSNGTTSEEEEPASGNTTDAEMAVPQEWRCDPCGIFWLRKARGMVTFHKGTHRIENNRTICSGCSTTWIADGAPMRMSSLVLRPSKHLRFGPRTEGIPPKKRRALLSFFVGRRGPWRCGHLLRFHWGQWDKKGLFGVLDCISLHGSGLGRNCLDGQKTITVSLVQW